MLLSEQYTRTSLVVPADQRRAMRVLLVEDNPGDIRLMKEALARGPVPTHLSVVDNGEDALAYLRRRDPYRDATKPDLILLDLNLPRKDGREVLADIKGHEELRRIPVVVLTTSQSQTDVQRVYDLHANCYIQKPVDLDEYLRVVYVCQTFWFQVVRLPVK